MTTEQQGQGAEGSTPSEETPPRTVQVGDQQMTEENLIKSYQEARSELTRKSQEVADSNRKLEGYSWADEFTQRWNSDSGFREKIQDAYGADTTSYQQMQPQSREIEALRAEQQLLRFERSFDQIRASGQELSKDDEQRILHEIATNPQWREARDAEPVYRQLFWDRAMKGAREQATSQTAENMARAQGSYESPPRGGAQKTEKGPDVGSMTEEQRDDYLMQRIKDLDMYKE